MKNNNHKNPIKDQANIDEAIDEFAYPATEDIYNQAEKIATIDPEDTSHLKEKNLEGEYELNEKNPNDVSDSNLDIPGAELDDQQEAIGSEDEENNYYSIGGDNHNDLEERKDS